MHSHIEAVVFKKPHQHRKCKSLIKSSAFGLFFTQPTSNSASAHQHGLVRCLVLSQIIYHSFTTAGQINMPVWSPMKWTVQCAFQFLKRRPENANCNVTRTFIALWCQWCTLCLIYIASPWADATRTFTMAVINFYIGLRAYIVACVLMCTCQINCSKYSES